MAAEVNLPSFKVESGPLGGGRGRRCRSVRRWTDRDGTGCHGWYPEEAAHEAGTVEDLLPGLLRGNVNRVAPYQDTHDLLMPAWTAVCGVTWRAVGAVVGR